MNADFSYNEKTDLINGSAFAVLNEVGHGYHEKPCENGLTVEFQFREIPFVQQPRYPIFYRGVQIPEFVSDLIALKKSSWMPMKSSR
jgi:GxxExxY protein